MEKVKYPITDEEYKNLESLSANNYILLVDSPPPKGEGLVHKFYAYVNITQYTSEDAPIIDDGFYWVDENTGRKSDAVGSLSIKSWYVKGFLKSSNLELLNKNIENVYNILDLKPEAIELICSQGLIPYDYEVLKELVENDERFTILLTLENAYEELKALFILTNGLYSLTVTVNNSKSNPLFSLDDYLYTEHDTVEFYINNTLIPLTIRELITIDI